MDLRSRLLLPLVCALVLLIVYTTVYAESIAPAALTVLGLAALLVLVAAVNVEVTVHGPLRNLISFARDLAGGVNRESQMKDAKGEVGELAASLTRLHALMRDADMSLEQESSKRRELEQSLREAEERYLLAVERANDGIWEWDVNANRVEFSPRWKGMLGHPDLDFARIEDWKELVHPSDRETVSIRLFNSLEALTPYFDGEYRVRHGNGRHIWVHSRGIAIRHASGKPYRMVVMDNDIHARKELEETLIQAAEGLSAVSGMDFFRALIRNLSSILGTRDNIICHCLDDPPTRVRALAYYTNGSFCEEPIEYDLDGTSCGAVIKKGEIVYCPTGVCDIWPLEKEYDRDSYIGVPMFDSNGKIIGHFACMDGRPMRQDLPHLALFKIFSVRAAAELERTLLKRKLGTHEV